MLYFCVERCFTRPFWHRTSFSPVQGSDVIRGEGRLLFYLSLFTHIISARKGQLNFKSVVCEQNSSHPVIKRSFYERAKIVYSQIAERVTPLPGINSSLAKKTVLVRIQSSVVIILRPRGMWASPRFDAHPISGEYLPVSLVTCDSTRLVFCSHSHLLKNNISLIRSLCTGKHGLSRAFGVLSLHHHKITGRGLGHRRRDHHWNFVDRCRCQIKPGKKIYCGDLLLDCVSCVGVSLCRTRKKILKGSGGDMKLEQYYVEFLF